MILLNLFQNLDDMNRLWIRLNNIDALKKELQRKRKGIIKIFS